MTQKPSLIGPSFADAVSIIATTDELPEQTRRHWATSLRQVAKALDRPMETIPAQFGAVRARLSELHHVPSGLTRKTLQNHKSNVKSALLWLARENRIAKHRSALTPAWEALQVMIKNRFDKWRLSPLVRFCSVSGIAPTDVDDAVLGRFLQHRGVSGAPSGDKSGRRLVRTWNSNIGKVQGWPARRLTEPPVKALTAVPWADFPVGLRRDVDQYLQGLTKVRRGQGGRRIRPLKPSTIGARRAELRAAARMAVKNGVPISDLGSLSALLSPDVVGKILDAYWIKNGETPRAYTIDLACRIASIARRTEGVDESARERLDEMRRALEDERRGGLTDKNAALIRKVLTPGVWERVVRLPKDLMASARSQRLSSPHRAAVMAQLAAAIAILTVAPVRLANLRAIRLGTNLIKPGGPGSPYWLVFPDYDVKNRVKLEYQLDPRLAPIIDEYVHDFRPALLRGRNEDWLFPGEKGRAKSPTLLSGQITQTIYRKTGLRMTTHQFRHAAGALFLQARPGEYELVRQLLGHRNIQTTIKAYIGLENIHASEIFGKLVMKRMSDALEAAE